MQIGSFSSGRISLTEDFNDSHLKKMLKISRIDNFLGYSPIGYILFLLKRKKKTNKSQQPNLREKLKPRCPGPDPNYLNVKMRNNFVNANAVQIIISS